MHFLWKLISVPVRLLGTPEYQASILILSTKKVKWGQFTFSYGVMKGQNLREDQHRGHLISRLKLNFEVKIKTERDWHQNCSWGQNCGHDENCGHGENCGQIKNFGRGGQDRGQM